jgi:hypothetical protein
MTEREIFGSGLLLGGYHSFKLKLAAKLAVSSVASGRNSASFVPPIVFFADSGCS